VPILNQVLHHEDMLYLTKYHAMET